MGLQLRDCITYLPQLAGFARAPLSMAVNCDKPLRVSLRSCGSLFKQSSRSFVSNASEAGVLAPS